MPDDINRGQPADETIAMIAEYMEKGFLENITDMLRHDHALFASIPVMIVDQRSRVRIGAVALAETLKPEYARELVSIAGEAGAGLNHADAVVRGDTAYLLSVIGGDEALRLMKCALASEENAAVLDVLREAVEELGG